MDLPREFARTLPMVSSGTVTRAARARRLGQSMERVSQRINAPIKIPSTCMAELVIPDGAGRKRKPMMQRRAAKMEIVRFMCNPPFHNLNQIQAPCRRSSA